ncbi:MULTISPECIES: TetR family transcriptional regulator [unclassified Curtobacterium]|uniref:TetR family transcriptional regulator n=1 Tax=unclassified Curtobacterium TaxID=257496 RepID=UPI0015E8CC08|nr:MULTISPECIES: TetR family transcriptional regulator [unclassified Curtobacterium]WIB33233.1 TetR family transcriptional regulator [Curtobacterium sp. MCSS17_005]
MTETRAVSAENAARGRYAKSTATRARAIRAAIAAATAPDGQTTLRALAEAAGLTDAGLLHHYGSRDGLLLAAAVDLVQTGRGRRTELAALTREVVRIACDRRSPARAEALMELDRQRAAGGLGRLGLVLDAAMGAGTR